MAAFPEKAQIVPLDTPTWKDFPLQKLMYLFNLAWISTRKDTYSEVSHGLERMYYRDLPLLALVDTLPKSRYEIPPGPVSTTTLIGWNGDPLPIKIPSASERRDYQRARLF